MSSLTWVLAVIFLFYCFFDVHQDSSKGEINARREDLLPNREAVVPVGICRRVHEEQTSMSKLQLHRINLSAALFPSSISVSKDKVSSCS